VAANFLGTILLMNPAQRVLLLPLRPLQAEHLQFLREVESPFVTGGEADFQDLILATFICAQSADSARRTIGRWWAFPLIRVWGWACRWSNLVWPHEAAKLRRHLESGRN
jgi:hypothetical protein